MQVILLESVQNLGELGATVKVKSGFARNFLIPKGKAVAATAANLKEFEARRAEYERQQEEVLAVARSRAEGLEGLVVAIERKAGEEGKLFGSVGAGDVAEAITAAGVEVQRAEVRLPEPVLRQVGDYEVTIALHARAHAKVTVQVVAG